MSQTAERLSALNSAVSSSLSELGEDARTYLESLSKLESTPPESDDYESVRAAVHVLVTTLMAHATTTAELLEDALDALPDDGE